MKKRMRLTASQFYMDLQHSQITSDILEALCCMIFATTKMLIEDLPSSPNQWEH